MINATKLSIAKRLGLSFGVPEEMAILNRYYPDERALSSHGLAEFVNKVYVSASAAESEFDKIEELAGSLIYDAKALANAQIVGTVQTGAIPLARNGYSDFRVVFPDNDGVLSDVKRCGRYLFNCAIMTLIPIAGTKIGFSRGAALPTIESNVHGTKFLSFVHDGLMLGDLTLSFSMVKAQQINTIALETIFPLKNNVRTIRFFLNGAIVATVSNGIFKDGNHHYEKITSLPGIIYYSGESVTADQIKIELDIGTFANNYHSNDAEVIYSALSGKEVRDAPCNSSMILGDIMIGNAVKSEQSSVKIYEDTSKKIAISSGMKFSNDTDGIVFTLDRYSPVTQKPETVLGPFVIGKR